MGVVTTLANTFFLFKKKKKKKINLCCQGSLKFVSHRWFIFAVLRKNSDRAIIGIENAYYYTNANLQQEKRDSRLKLLVDVVQ